MKCPLCHAKETQFFAEKYTYQFYRCTQCKTIYLDSLPSQKQLNVYYSKQFSYSDGFLNEVVIRKRSSSVLNILKRCAPHAKTICDVGSGYGFFLDEAQKAGYIAFGIEPSKKLAFHAEKKYHISTYQGSLERYINKKKKQFDVVTCIHVIEHVSHPKQFISQLLKLLKPGGILFLETPNSDSHLLYMEKEQYTFLIPPDHLWLFSHYSIQSLLPNSFEIVYKNTYSYSEHFMGIMKSVVTNMSLRAKHNEARLPRQPACRQVVFTPRNDINNIRKKLSYYLFDRGIAPLFTGMLNQYHKGSILELCIRKKVGKSGL